jgi:hypothetical protein
MPRRSAALQHERWREAEVPIELPERPVRHQVGDERVELEPASEEMADGDRVRLPLRAVAGGEVLIESQKSWKQASESSAVAGGTEVRRSWWRRV